jgi:UPF0176 protein
VNLTLNISAYLFVTLDDAPVLRERIHTSAQAAGLKGTVLLAQEGINLFIAGPADAVRSWVATLRQDARLAALEAKESWSATVPFRRLLVKCKPEIIRMNHPTIRPAAGRAPAVDAATLARWLDTGRDDAGRPVVMLDTRNSFEVAQGRFHGAIDLGIERFSDFPQAALRERSRFAGKTVVSYCTGGIRCEKAAILLEQAGIEQVLQLDGGILRYFELTGGRHFEGECFVFDERVALNHQLQAEPA